MATDQASSSRRPRSNSFSLGSPILLPSTSESSSSPIATTAAPRTPSPPPISPINNRPNLTLDLTSTNTVLDPDADLPLPVPTESTQDLYFDDEGLGTLEKIYLFSRSRAVFHRVFISRSLSSCLPDVSPAEAVEYVLPLLNGLGTDMEEAVKEAFVMELVPVIWWFFTNCRVTDSDMYEPLTYEDSKSPPNGIVPQIPVSTFTPLFGSLLLSPNAVVGDAARWAVVELLTRVRKTDSESVSPLLGNTEKSLIERELLQGVVIGMARLDFADPAAEEQSYPSDGTALEYQPTGSDIPGQPPPLSPDSSAPSLSPIQTRKSSDTTPLDDDTHSSNYSSSSSSPSSPSTPTALHSIFNSSTSPRNTTTDDTGWISPSTPTGPEENAEWQEGGEGNSYPLEDTYGQEGDASEEAAVGRAASMSLIAAVTASGVLAETDAVLFVDEVARVGKDTVYWVRREAAYALGALAKVVAIELIDSVLLSLYDSFTTDETWHVRHSALFALPGLLNRMKPTERRSMALTQIKVLALDDSRTVRSGLLEVLGEVIYTFHDDDLGPPAQLIQLFIGQDPTQDRGNWSPNEIMGSWLIDPMSGAPLRPRGDIDGQVSPSSPDADTEMEDQFRDPDRPLICAFNFPAVALTLGRSRWGELRQYYLTLAQDRTPKVRRTLAASLGEVAKIVGPEHTKRDLVPIWWDAIQTGEHDIRLKIIGNLIVFLGALDEGYRTVLGKELEHVWQAFLTGWREREACAKTIGGLSALLVRAGDTLRRLLLKALTDDVAAVREAAVAEVPVCMEAMRSDAPTLQHLRDDLETLSQAASFRQRSTYVACCQGLLFHETMGHVELNRERLWNTLSVLSKDVVIDVRIGVSRLIGMICEKYFCDRRRPDLIDRIIHSLLNDESVEVRSFVYFLLAPPLLPPLDNNNNPLPKPSKPITTTASAPASPTSSPKFATFSRPPPPPSSGPPAR